MEYGSGGSTRETGSGGKAQQAAGEVKEQAQQVTQQTQEKAGQAMEQVREQTKSQLAGQKEQAAGGLNSVAQALRQSGQHLREQDQGAIGQYADKTAEHVERFSGYLREKDVEQLVNEVEGFARRKPALFLGGAFALGLMGARFLKSSNQSGGSVSEGYGTASETYPYTTSPGASEFTMPYEGEVDTDPVSYRESVEGQRLRPFEEA